MTSPLNPTIADQLIWTKIISCEYVNPPLNLHLWSVNLWILGALPHHRKWEMVWSIVLKNCFGRKSGRQWNKNRNLGKMFILTALILPINERGKLLLLWRSDLILDIKGRKLAEKREFSVLVTLFPRYLKPDRLNLKGMSDCLSCIAEALTG